MTAAGSSPLTRGKRWQPAAQQPPAGLIPAHAGKTDSGNRSWIISRAHPRSRGENVRPKPASVYLVGSSPLTRGKLPAASRQLPGHGLIPAHAGKTHLPGRAAYQAGAHPRSRGENQEGGQVAGLGLGLIPAHAGKTRRWIVRPGGHGAHPRSRGENSDWETIDGRAGGSSPLTRGKPSCNAGLVTGLGLIPAHAGKTLWAFCNKNLPWAHPRSRGENLRQHKLGLPGKGSSPLTRGKRPGLAWVGLGWGLIPAHAGKTPISSRRKHDRRAHPRSRGENKVVTRPVTRPAGSSPLTRGKPAPAPTTRLAKTAHPRSRGENAPVPDLGDALQGSSPLTRGKPGRGLRRRRGRRLIPAHAGKTPRLGPTSCNNGAHPRSRGENAFFLR